MSSTAPPEEIVATAEIVASQGIPKIWQKGSCHCGAVKFEVLHESLYQIPDKTVQLHVIRCNCSICTSNGYLLIYPERYELRWISGLEEMKMYKFNTLSREHRFCGVCGSSICIDYMGLWKHGDLIGVNVRMLEDIDIDKLKLRKKDHKNQNN